MEGLCSMHHELFISPDPSLTGAKMKRGHIEFLPRMMQDFVAIVPSLRRPMRAIRSPVNVSCRRR